MLPDKKLESGGFLPDDILDLLEDRQDLSQYSYDPDDRLETVTFPDSQHSSQSSDKPDVFVGVCEDDDDDDQKLADCNAQDMTTCLNDNDTQPGMSHDTTGLDEYPCPTNNVTGWLATVEEVNLVSTGRDVSSVLWLNDTCQHTHDLQVFRTESAVLYIIN